MLWSMIVRLLPFAFLLVILTASMNFPILDSHPAATWTILAYYGGDNDLENHLIHDVNEFELAGGSTDTIRVITFLDRAEGYYQSPVADWSGARVYEIGPDRSEDHLTRYPPTIDTAPLSDLGPVDSADPVTLSTFLTWGIQTYPADHYAIVFGSHGAAWEGIVRDYSAGSLLGLDDLRSAFDQVREATGIKRFDLLINDACLMSSFEYYTVMSDYFDYAIGSAELITSPAYDMTELIAQLEAGTALSDIGGALIDRYLNTTAPALTPGLVPYFTGAVIDLRAFMTLNTALDDFMAVFERDPERYAPILARARATTYTYSAFSNRTTEIDLGDLMRQIREDPDLISAAQAVLTTLDQLVIYGAAGPIAAQATTHLNLYFPASQSLFRSDYQALPRWAALLEAYYTALATPDQGDFHPVGEPQMTIDARPTARYDHGYALGLTVTGRNISQAALTVRDESGQLLTRTPILNWVIGVAGDRLIPQNQWTPGVTLTSARWAVAAYRLSDAPDAIGDYAPLIQAPNGESIYSLQAEYRTSDQAAWSPVTLTFTPDTSLMADLRVEAVIPVGESAAVIDLPEGVQVRVGTRIYRWTDDWRLRAFETPVPSGQYQLEVSLEAYGGAILSESHSVSVDHSALDPARRGHDWTPEFGFRLTLPDAWSDRFAYFTAYLSNGVEITRADSENPDTLAMFVNHYPGLDLESATQLAIRSVGGTAAVEVRPGPPLQGRPTLEFAFLGAPRINDQWQNRGFSVYDPERDQVLVFLAANRDATQSPEVLDQFYREMRASIVFEERGSTPWGRDRLADHAQVTIPAVWNSNTIEIWRRYQDPDSPFTFAAFSTEAIAQSHFETLRQTEVIDHRSYGPWQVVSYRRSSGRISGRIYTAMIDGLPYTARFEAPSLEADRQFRAVFEPMLDGLMISPRVIHAEFPGFGIAFDRPTDDTWTANLYEQAQNKVFYINDPGTRLIELFLVPDTDQTLFSLATTVQQVGLLPSDPQYITIGTTQGLLFMAEGKPDATETWRGQYLAVYDSERRLGWVIGVRAIEGLGEYQAAFDLIRESLILTPGPYDPYIDLDFKAEDFSIRELFGFTTHVPLAWESLVLEGNVEANVEVFSLNTFDQSIIFYVFEGAQNLTQVGAEFFPAEGTPITVDGRLALEYRYTTIDGLSGQAFSLNDPYRDQLIIVEVIGSEVIYRVVRDHFRLLER